MRTKFFAITTIFVIFIAVAINTVFLRKEISGVINKVESIDTRSENALALAIRTQEDFRKTENFISITVSHDDLTNIEDGFAELVGYLKVSDSDGAEIVKSRLINSLEHLRRLSGVNFDSIS